MCNFPGTLGEQPQTWKIQEPWVYPQAWKSRGNPKKTGLEILGKLGKQGNFGKSRNLRVTSRPGNPGKTPGKIGEHPQVWKTWQVREFLGLGILRKTRENLENLGTLGVPLGLEIQETPRENLENTSWPGNPGKTKGKFRKSRSLLAWKSQEKTRETGKLWKIQEPSDYFQAWEVLGKIPVPGNAPRSGKLGKCGNSQASESSEKLGKTWKIQEPWVYPQAWKSRKHPGKTWKIPLGLEILGKPREILENLGASGPGNPRKNQGNRETLENLGTLGLLLGLGILGKLPEKSGSTPRSGKLGKCGNSQASESSDKLEKTWKIQEPWVYSQAWKSRAKPGKAWKIPLGLEIPEKTRETGKLWKIQEPSDYFQAWESWENSRKNRGAPLGLENLESAGIPRPRNPQKNQRKPGKSRNPGCTPRPGNPGETQGKPGKYLLAWKSQKKLGKQGNFGKSRNLRITSRPGNLGKTPRKIGEHPQAWKTWKVREFLSLGILRKIRERPGKSRNPGCTPRPGNPRKTQGKPGKYLLAWKSWENQGKFQKIQEPLGLEILGKTRENLENLGTFGLFLGLEVLGKIPVPGNTPRSGKLGKCGNSQASESSEKLEKTWKIQEPWVYPYAWKSRKRPGKTLKIPLGLDILGKPKENSENLGASGPGNPRKNQGNRKTLENLGTLGLLLGLEVLGKLPEKSGSTPRSGKLGKRGNSQASENPQKPQVYPQA